MDSSMEVEEDIKEVVEDIRAEVDMVIFVVEKEGEEGKNEDVIIRNFVVKFAQLFFGIFEFDILFFFKPENCKLFKKL